VTFIKQAAIDAGEDEPVVWSLKILCLFDRDSFGLNLTVLSTVKELEVYKPSFLLFESTEMPSVTKFPATLGIPGSILDPDRNGETMLGRLLKIPDGVWLSDTLALEPDISKSVETS
jgi:hypothetical protein